MPLSAMISTRCSATETKSSTPVRPVVVCRFWARNCSLARRLALALAIDFGTSAMRTLRVPRERQEREKDEELNEEDPLHLHPGEMDERPRNDERQQRRPHERDMLIAAALFSNDGDDLAGRRAFGVGDRL